jgi:hypothetical protein
MEKEFVTYELALRMKQLGFDEPCFAGFNPTPFDYDDVENLIYPTIKLDFEDEDIIFNDTESDQPNCWTIEDDVILAPLYQQAFRWLIPQIDNEWKVCLGEEGWYIYNLENEIYYGENALEKLIEIIENQK